MLLRQEDPFQALDKKWSFINQYVFTCYSKINSMAYTRYIAINIANTLKFEDRQCGDKLRNYDLR